MDARSERRLLERASRALSPLMLAGSVVAWCTVAAHFASKSHALLTPEGLALFIILPLSGVMWAAVFATRAVLGSAPEDAAPRDPSGRGAEAQEWLRMAASLNAGPHTANILQLLRVTPSEARSILRARRGAAAGNRDARRAPGRPTFAVRDGALRAAMDACAARAPAAAA